MTGCVTKPANSWLHAWGATDRATACLALARRPRRQSGTRMHRQGTGEFKYYVGISSLSQIATRQDRVCVLNILGGESSEVTPVGHEFSGGNVVFGTSPGRRGQVLETNNGKIPVYNRVREGLGGGSRFSVGGG